MATTTKLFIQEGDQIIELTGDAKAEFIADREAIAQSNALLKAEYQAKQDARESAIKKLAEAAGLTTEEIEGLIK